MTVQYSDDVRNARLASDETTIGAAPILELRTGSQAANCAAGGAGTLLAQGALPSDWQSAPASGAATKSGSWTVTGIAAGDIGHFRILSAGSPSVCHMQGSVTATGGGGDMTVDNVSLAVSQVVTVNTFTRTAAGA